jgi:hypothetical protein
MGKIIDQYHDDPTYVQLHILTRDRPLVREMLKTASFDEKKAAIEDLPSSAFAWEDERRFPVHTKEDTIASILYRSKLGSAGNVPIQVDEKLAKAAAVYGVTEHVFVTKVAAAPEDVEYAVPEQKRLPLSTVAQIKTAEHVLCREYSKLPLEKRADAFSRLAVAARKLNVELSPLSQKMAGLTVSDTTKLGDWLEARAAATEGPVREAFDKLASSLRNTRTVLQDRRDLIKLASTIDQLDRKAGLDSYYDRKLPDPLLTVFNTDKRASVTCDVGGTQMPVEQLMQLPPEVWEQLDAPELAQLAEAGDVEMFKQVFDTLPLDMKVALQGQLVR